MNKYIPHIYHTIRIMEKNSSYKKVKVCLYDLLEQEVRELPGIQIAAIRVAVSPGPITFEGIKKLVPFDNSFNETQFIHILSTQFQYNRFDWSFKKSHSISDLSQSFYTIAEHGNIDIVLFVSLVPSAYLSKQYFDDCKTESHVNKRFRKLSKDHAPRTTEELSDKDKTVLMQDIHQQKIAALRRIAVSEGRAVSYYEELAAKVGKDDFLSSIINSAREIDKKLESDGVTGNSFNDIFNAVAKMFHEPKKGNKLENANPGPLKIPEGPGKNA